MNNVNETKFGFDSNMAKSAIVHKPQAATTTPTKNRRNETINEFMNPFSHHILDCKTSKKKKKYETKRNETNANLFLNV